MFNKNHNHLKLTNSRVRLHIDIRIYKLRVKWDSFKAIELEMTMLLLEFLERHRARHLFRSIYLKVVRLI